MREKIIDATVEEFKQNGLKFTMNDLAKHLGISKKTIYTVFESKQAVLVAVADRYAADLNSMQEELEADVSLNVVQKLEKLLCALPEKYSNVWTGKSSKRHGNGHDAGMHERVKVG